MDISVISSFRAEDIMPLYQSAGWTGYVNNPDMVRAAHENSLLIIGAYESGHLIGFIRAVGDGASIVLIQDIIVSPMHRRRGIGSRLMSAMMERYAGVYQMELMTDDRPDTAAFYESLGFKKAQDLGCCAYMRM